MRVGLSSRIYFRRDVDARDALRRAAECTGLIEVWCSKRFLSCWGGRGEGEEVSEVANLAGSLPLSTSIHAARIGNNLASESGNVKKESIEEIRRAAEYAIFFGADTVTFHPGEVEGDYGRAVESVRESLEILDNLGKWCEATLCLENPGKPETPCRTGLELFEVIEGLDNIFITFDIAHAAAQPDTVPRDFIEVLGDRIRHVHVSDARRNTPEHLPIGAGEIDFMEYFKALFDVGFDGNVILEEVSGIEKGNILLDIGLVGGLLSDVGYTLSL